MGTPSLLKQYSVTSLARSLGLSRRQWTSRPATVRDSASVTSKSCRSVALKNENGPAVLRRESPSGSISEHSQCSALPEQPIVSVLLSPAIMTEEGSDASAEMISIHARGGLLMATYVSPSWPSRVVVW